MREIERRKGSRGGRDEGKETQSQLTTPVKYNHKTRRCPALSVRQTAPVGLPGRRLDVV